MPFSPSSKRNSSFFRATASRKSISGMVPFRRARSVSATNSSSLPLCCSALLHGRDFRALRRAVVRRRGCRLFDRFFGRAAGIGLLPVCMPRLFPATARDGRFHVELHRGKGPRCHAKQERGMLGKLRSRVCAWRAHEKNPQFRQRTLAGACHYGFFEKRLYFTCGH